MDNWTWLDELCLRVYAKVVSSYWHWQYLGEKEIERRKSENGRI